MQGLERLHFFNGQRLVARDLELEQKYFIRVRRLLNKGLYSAGVVSGLEVSAVDLVHVKVTRGIAFDARGREAILLTDTTVSVPNRLPTSPIKGFFLVINYGEEVEPGHMADCKPGSGTTPPAKILEAPTLSWTEIWPDHNKCGEKGHASDCGVVLALVLLDSSCHISKIDPGVRQFAHSTVPGQVHPFALEGEKDIDNANPKKLHFQISGGPPDSVLLFLWGDAMSSLLYTELGNHTHAVGGVTAANTTTDLGNHNHKVPDMQSSDDGAHSHQIRQAGEDFEDPSSNDAIETDPFNSALLGNAGRIAYGPQNAGPGMNYIQIDGGHHHSVTGPTTQGPAPNASTPHAHTLSGNVAAAGNTAPLTGNTPYAARGGPAYSYADDMHVKLDGTDITGLIRAKLGWAKLGDGTATHALVLSGTGAVDLVQLGLPLIVGPHEIELRVNSGGGKVLFNLYVE